MCLPSISIYFGECYKCCRAFVTCLALNLIKTSFSHLTDSCTGLGHMGKAKIVISPFDCLLCRKVSNGKMAHRDFPIWPYPADLLPFAMFLPVPIWPLTVWPAPASSTFSPADFFGGKKLWRPRQRPRCCLPNSPSRTFAQRGNKLFAPLPSPFPSILPSKIKIRTFRRRREGKHSTVQGWAKLRGLQPPSSYRHGLGSGLVLLSNRQVGPGNIECNSRSPL